MHIKATYNGGYKCNQLVFVQKNVPMKLSYLILSNKSIKFII
jgi:hypothetical protein